MPTYKLSPEGNAQIKKTWKRTMWLYYAVIISVFAYNLLYKYSKPLNTGIFVCIVIALAAGYFYGRKKYDAITDSTHLIVNDDGMTLQVLDKPDVSMAFTNIKKMNHRKDGMYLVSKDATKPSLLIVNQFEKFYEIEKLINDKIHENELQKHI
jgi:hypothetical protein